jgi:uncharacterized protein YkwD
VTVPSVARGWIAVLVLLACSAAFAAALRPKPADELVALINDYRSAHRFCDGKTVPAAGPLAPDPQLAGLRLDRDADLQALLKKAGYRAARAQAIVVSGPRDAQAAMTLLRTKYCEPISSAQFAQVGVARDGNTWRLVLGQPLLSPGLGDWREAGNEILGLTNQARAVPRVCGSRSFAAASPLAWDGRLARAALAHSQEMARRNYFSHTGKDGAKVAARAEQAGYAWRGIGENLAAGQGTPALAVAGWLASPTHCANIMNAGFSQMGAAYAVNFDSDTGIYWTQVFGTPQ